MAGGNDDIDLRVTDRSANLFQSPHTGEHCITGNDGFVPRKGEASCNPHLILLSNPHIDVAAGESLGELHGVSRTGDISI